MTDYNTFEAWLANFQTVEQTVFLGRAFNDAFLTERNTQLTNMQCDHEALKIIRQFYVSDYVVLANGQYITQEV